MTPIPTITLAKLYEQQEQYIEALALYQMLSKKNNTEKYLDKISEIKEIVFSSNQKEYHKLLLNLFTKEERNELQVLPHNEYLDYTEVIELYKETQEITPTKEPKPTDKTTPILADILEKLDKIDSDDLNKLAKEKFNKSVSNLTITEIRELISQ
ncbi:MAG: hypothetical protein KAS49_03515 [Candidatus Cloacimonetes bacterium]|nr:hypothetical protein [Candidatus Cloacimonadota bacterium]